MNILIADDFQPVRKSLRRMLEAVPGITDIAEAADGAEALKLFHELRPEVMVLDVQMPGKTGMAFLEEIANDLSHTTIIILTNYATSELRKKCLRFGANYVLDKSMEFSRVIDIVAALHRGNQMQQGHHSFHEE